MKMPTKRAKTTSHKRIHKRTQKRKGVLLSLFLVFAMLSTSIISLTSLSSTVNAQTSDVCPIAVYEGEKVKLAPAAYDPDPEIGPAGEFLWSVSRPFDEKGEWQTTKGKRGIFNFWLKVSDGELYDTEYSCVEVLPNNRDPVLLPISDLTITKGESTKLYATCSDPDGDQVKIDYYVNGKNMQYLLYQPPGTYRFTVMCTDGYGGADYQSATLTVKETIPQTIIKKVKKIVNIPVEEPTPVETEIVMPEPEKVTVQTEIIDDSYCSTVCGASRTGEIDVIVYDEIHEMIGEAGDTRTFEIQKNPEPVEPFVVQKPAEPVNEPTTKPADRQSNIKKTICGKPVVEAVPVNKPVEPDEPKNLETAQDRKSRVDDLYKCGCY